jgi:acyl transferase domain-containing protein
MDQQRTGLEIAVIGMAGRFPRAASPDELWANVLDGRSSVRFFTEDEVISAGVPEARARLPRYVRAWGALTDPDRFDATFFGYAPRDAALLDPQQRVFLECAHHALEHAGYASQQHKELIGVYAGGSLSAYLLHYLLRNPAVEGNVRFDELVLANDKDHLATRVSYHLNLEGPSVAVQTACSSSLVAVHLACQALLARDCDIALAGGVSIQLPQTGYLTEPGSILADDGVCLPFDARAHGVVPGSGAAIVVLKPLEDALRDRDTIHAVILGSAVNNDGSSKVGYTAPRIGSQEAAVRTAQRLAEVGAETIGYIEAHGTATALGDPIEVAALTRAFRTSTERTGFCALGSIKAQIGHLDAAAGVTGLIKTVYALREGILPPSPYFQEAIPALELADGPFYIPTVCTPWPDGPHPRRAGVNSLGMGGTNAHVVLEQSPVGPPPAAAGPAWHVLPLSARTPQALRELRADLATQLSGDPRADLADVAGTLQTGRRAMPHRLALVCRDSEGAADLLANGGSRLWQGTTESRDAPVVFMFPGQGAQHPSMARGLYEADKTFRRWFDRGAEEFRAHQDHDLRDVLTSERLLATTHYAQAALFTVEYALAQTWLSWGIRVDAMIGHSVGEYVAACLADVFDLPDAVAVVAARGELMNRLPDGAMLAVAMPAPVAERELDSGLCLAADNGPQMCVVSGQSTSVERLEHRLRERGVACQRLAVAHAFHSPMLEPLLQELAGRVGKVRLHPPVIPFLSSATGGWISQADATDPWYWARQAMRPVLFRPGIEELLRDGGRVLLEVGPGQALSSLVKGYGQAAGNTVLASLPRPGARTPDEVAFASAVARLWLAGCAIDWPGGPGRVPLPLYPFERQRHWIDRPADLPAAAGPAPQGVPDSADSLEQIISRAWAELLGIPEIRADDDFFELGGSSLLAARVIARINDEMGIGLSPGVIFGAPTIAALRQAALAAIAEQAGDLIDEIGGA